MISITVKLNSAIIENLENGEIDKSIGRLSVYGYVPSNSTSNNMKYIECVLLENEEFTCKNFASLLKAICSVEKLPEVKPISSHNACIHADKVYKCYDNPKSSRNFLYAGYLPNAKMLCNNTVLVYDKIEGTHCPQNIKQVFCILKCLCDLWKKNLCHGDIRLANMIFDDASSSTLIDFDFCGQDGKAEYPQGYNTELSDTVRHKEAKAGCVLKKEHDWFSMQSILGWYKCEAEKVLWQSLLDKETTWDKVMDLVSACSMDKLNATLTQTNDNPFKDTIPKSNHTDSPPKPNTKRKRSCDTSQNLPPEKKQKTF